MRGSEHALEWEEPERLEQEKAKQVDQHDDVKTCLSGGGCAGGEIVWANANVQLQQSICLTLPI